MKKHTPIIDVVVMFVFIILIMKPSPVLSAKSMFISTSNSTTNPSDSLISSQQSNVPFYSMPIREDVYLLGCQNIGFSGYFGIENWEIKKSGDGGVDVTGAPNGLLIQTVGKSPGKENPRDEWQCKIVIPSEGYLYLDLEKIGGSIFSMEYSVNGAQRQPLYRSDKKIQSQFTNLLHRNDVLEITLSFDGSKNNTFLLKDFNFFTNTEKIKQKTALFYTFTDGIPTFYCQKTFESTPILGIGNIILPANTSTSPEKTTPKYTGYPVVDTDGLAYTKEDQFRLDNRVTPFELKWSDKISTINDQTTIERKWVVKDQCKGNILMATQSILIETPTGLALKSKSSISLLK